MKTAIATTIAVLVLAAPAQATLKMHGAKPRHWAWATAAQQHVPLPDARVYLNQGDPSYEWFADGRGGRMYLPTPGRGGWTYLDEHALFLHELGHVVWFRHVTATERARFRAVSGSSASVPFYERFAEAYGACARDMSRAELEDTGAPSYGWDPSTGKTDLCALVTELSQR